MKPNYYTGEEESKLDAVYDHLDEITDTELLKKLLDDIDRRVKRRIAEEHISNIRSAIHDAQANGLTIQFINCHTLETFTVKDSNYCVLIQQRHRRYFF